ncbi:hypothetical protein NMY22_g4077 [Coprinellus aureogranulatus]|nr:hypothetical protein NMY22_g4077 [Coprinellus aureogranulatus]
MASGALITTAPIANVPLSPSVAPITLISREHQESSIQEKERLEACTSIIKGVIQVYIQRCSPFNKQWNPKHIPYYLPQHRGDDHIGTPTPEFHIKHSACCFSNKLPGNTSGGDNGDAFQPGKSQWMESTISSAKTIEGATQRTPTSPCPSTHKVLKTLSFKKNTAAPAAPNPLVEDNFIPMGDTDADGSPEPESVIITV